MNTYKSKIYTRLLSMLMIIMMGVFGASSYAQEAGAKKHITINKPDIYRTQNTTYIAAAQMFKALGKAVNWDTRNKQLIVNYGELIFKLEQTQVETKAASLYLQKAAISKDGKLYIPLNFYAEALGYDVSYKEGLIRLEGYEQLGKKGKYEEVIQEKRITISAAGDFTLGYYKGQTSGGRFDEVAAKNGYSYFMKGVKSIFEADDLTIVNLEGPLTTRGVAAEKEFAIRGLPAYTQILTEGSIEAVNLANNHTYDYQKVGYDDTVAALQKNSIGYFGEENTYYTTINDIDIAVIGAKGWSNSADVKGKLKKRMTEAKAKADLIIVEFHWGEERQNYPNAIQQDLGKYAVDQGAHLVLGSHPHVIQGIGTYKDVNIVYSMGNFCFGANKNPSDKDTFIYTQTFIVTDAGVQTESYDVIPCSISSVNNRNDYQPTVLSGQAKQNVLDRVAVYSKNLSK